MKKFLKPTIWKILTTFFFLLIDNFISFGQPQFSFYNYFCSPILSATIGMEGDGRLICSRFGLNWVKLVVAIILFYILASLIALIPKKILKFVGWAILIIIVVGFIILFVGGIKF